MNKHQPLFNLRVLNTRPGPQNQFLSQRIQRLGGTSIELPALSIKTKSLPKQELTPPVNTKYAIFISPNAVHCYFEQLKTHKLAWNHDIQVFATGQGTAEILKQWHIHKVICPSIADSEHLIKLLPVKQDKPDAIVLIKGENGRTVLQKTLTKQGFPIKILEVYQRCMPQYPQAFINSLWQDDAVDIILFTSQQGMQQIFQMFKNEKTWLCSKPCIVLSERLKEAARLLGINQVFVTSYDKIIESLCDYHEGIRNGKS